MFIFFPPFFFLSSFLPISKYSERHDEHVQMTDIQQGPEHLAKPKHINPYPTAFPYGNGMVLHFYQQQESSTTKTVHKVINKGLKAYV